MHMSKCVCGHIHIAQSNHMDCGFNRWSHYISDIFARWAWLANYQLLLFGCVYFLLQSSCQHTNDRVKVYARATAYTMSFPLIKSSLCACALWRSSCSVENIKLCSKSNAKTHLYLFSLLCSVRAVASKWRTQNILSDTPGWATIQICALLRATSANSVAWENLFICKFDKQKQNGIANETHIFNMQSRLHTIYVHVCHSPDTRLS